MTFEHPTVSVVMPARDPGPAILSALRSVHDQDYPGRVEVIVADGSDGPAMRRGIQSAFPQVRVVDNPRRTIPAGLNLAISSAAGDIIVRCDSHSVLPSCYIRTAVEQLEGLSDRRVVCVGGRAVPVGTNVFGRAVARVVTTSVVSGNSRYKVGGQSGPIDTVYLGVFLRSAWEKVGGYDEALEANEDYELNWQFRLHGGVVWFSSLLQSTYRPRSTPLSLARQQFSYGRWKATMLLKNPRSLRWRQLAPPLILLGLVALIVFGFVTGRFLYPAVALGLYALMPLTQVGRRSARWDLSIALCPAVTLLMHCSWGLGFFFPRLRRARHAPSRTVAGG